MLDPTPSRPGSAARPGGVATVLAVEDNYVLLEMIATLCAQAGLTVLTASSGEAALTLLRDRGGEVDWLLTDINLPGLIDGWTVADEYRLSHPTRPIIYSSAHARDQRRILPGSLFVQKPFEVAELVKLARMMAATLSGVDDGADDETVPTLVGAG